MNLHDSPDVTESVALSRIEHHASAYLTDNDHRGYNRFIDFAWESLPDSVLKHQVGANLVSAVETAMLVEDHIPGYTSEYVRLFLPRPEMTNRQSWEARQMLHFVLRWAAEEDRHAHILELWLRNSGLTDPAGLETLMAEEGKKQYQAPHDEPTRLALYTTLQEKATQSFYLCLRQSTTEPVLRDVLGKIATDEARHCDFFSQLVMDAVRSGGDREVSAIKDVLANFQMPLAFMLKNYRRRARTMKMVASGFDHRDALEHLERLIRKTINATSASKSQTLEDLLLHVQSR